MGRPNGYTSKIAFADSRSSKTDTDGTQKDAIERAVRSRCFRTRTWRRAAPSTSRASLRAAGLGAEHDSYRDLFWSVSRDLSPGKAQDYERNSADWGWRESDENSAKKSSSPGLLSTASTVAGCSPSTMG